MFQEMTFSFIGFVGSAKTETKNGRKISTLRVARTDRWNGPNDEPQERTNWFTVTAFSDFVADLVASGSLTKGRYVVIRGDIRENRWEKDGKENSELQLVADFIRFADPKPE